MKMYPSNEGPATYRSGLGKAELRDMYIKMLHIRRFEEEIARLFSRSLMHGTTHLYVGEEAVAVGTMANLTDSDYITSTHRGHGHAIAKGMDINGMMAEMFGKKTGSCKGKGGSMHIADLAKGNLGANGIVGGGIPIATGAALSIKLLGQDRVVACFFGDGAMNEGTFHESVNMASVWRLPIIFVCENNLYGMSTSVRRSTNVEDLSVRAAAYGIPGRRVDGMDVFEVYDAVKEAKEYVKRNGPELIVAQTYRFKGHSKSDANKYRKREEIAAWEKRDPILLLRRYLLESGACSESEVDEMEAHCLKDVEESVRYSKACDDPGLEDLQSDLYAD
jgi:pyruvate dehydrogenase E1 component alpha subunit